MCALLMDARLEWGEQCQLFVHKQMFSMELISGADLSVALMYKHIADMTLQGEISCY